jgi:hypothetical protein
MSIDAFLITTAVVGAAVFVFAFPVVADVRLWTREGWNWWLVSLGLATLGATELADNAGLLADELDHALNRAVFVLFVFLTWHRIALLLTARREMRRRLHTQE